MNLQAYYDATPGSLSPEKKDYSRFYQILDLLEPGKTSLLDVGCSAGDMLNLLLENYQGLERIGGLDISPKRLELCEENLRGCKKYIVNPNKTVIENIRLMFKQSVDNNEDYSCIMNGRVITITRR